MIVPEKIIILTSDKNEDVRAEALKDYINGKVFGYRVIIINEEQFTDKVRVSWRNNLTTFFIRRKINIYDKLDSMRKLKLPKKQAGLPNYALKKSQDNIESKGKYKKVLNIIKRFNAKAIFCFNTATLYQAVKSREKFGFDAEIVAFFESFTLDKNTALLGADKYIVENKDFKEALIKSGIDKADIIVNKFPMPVSVFFEEDKNDCKAMFELDSKPAVMLNAGSAGDGRIIDIFKIFNEIQDKFNFVIYCGENEQLYIKLNKTVEEKKLKNYKILTTINHIEKLYMAMDCIISVYDVTAVYLSKLYGKPLIIFAPKRDVEESDIEYLVKNGDIAFAKDESDAIVKMFKATSSEPDEEKANTDDIRSATTTLANYMINLLSVKKKQNNEAE